MNEFCVVTTTVPSQLEATALAQRLIEQKLAACVQMVPVNSVYRWEGTMQVESEILLLIKTCTALFSEIESFIATQHSYDVPELVQLPIKQGAAAYLQWLATVLR